MDEIAVKVEHVSKDFKFSSSRSNTLKSMLTGITHKKDKNEKTQHALKDVSFEIKKGEFFGIVGRNGSGKSTLLKILAGIYQANKGSVSVLGKLVPFIELGVGFNPELTGRENVYLNGALLGFSEKEVDEFYQEVVAFAELEKFMNKKLKNYSSGMQVRLAFSMAVRAKADVLLIDEVLAVGDADFQRKCYEYFKKLKREKITVVFVSHDMGAIQEFCDRAVLVDKSVVKKIGKPNDVADDYLQLFVKEQPKQARVSQSGERWGDGIVIVKNLTASLKSDTLTISYSVQAREAVEGVVAGFRIRSTDGDNITGTNTKKERVVMPPIPKGGSVRVSWQVPNVFTDGDYFIDPSLVYPDELKVYDWWNEAETFSVNKNRNLPYPVDPGFTVTIS